MSSINIADHIASDDVNQMTENLYILLREIFDTHIPQATPRISNQPIWYNKQLINMKNIRNRHYRKLMQNRKENKDADSTNFEQARDKFDTYQRQLYEEYLKDLASDSKNNPKKFWSHINGKRKTNSLPCKLEFQGQTATTNQEKATLFSKFFSSVYKNHPTDDNLSDFIDKRNYNGV